MSLESKLVNYIVNMANYLNHTYTDNFVKSSRPNISKKINPINPTKKEYNSTYLHLELENETFSINKKYLPKFFNSIINSEKIEDLKKIIINKDVNKNNKKKDESYDLIIDDFINNYNNFIKKKISFKYKIENEKLDFFKECICIENPIEKHFNLKLTQFLIFKNDIIIRPESDILCNDPYIKFYFINGDILSKDVAFKDSLINNDILDKFINDIFYKESLKDIDEKIMKLIEKKNIAIKNKIDMYSDILYSSNYLQPITDVYTRLPYLKMLLTILELYLENKTDRLYIINNIYEMLIKDIIKYDKRIISPINLYPKEYNKKETKLLYNSLVIEQRIFTLVHYCKIFNIDIKLDILRKFKIIFNYEFIKPIKINE